MKYFIENFIALFFIILMIIPMFSMVLFILFAYNYIGRFFGKRTRCKFFSAWGQWNKMMKFVLIAPQDLVVGYFSLSDTTRQWTFKYSDSFKHSDFHPLEDFPLLNCVYGHETCVKWLVERISATDSIGKGFSLASVINSKFNRKGSPLELHLLQ